MKSITGKSRERAPFEYRPPGELVIVLAGEAGQGLLSIERILVSVLRKDGFNVFAAKEYMSRVRGGVNSTEIRVAETPVRSYVERIDVLIPLCEGAIPHLARRLSPDTVVLGDKAHLGYEGMVNIPFQEIASELGNPLFANTVAVGVLSGLLDVEAETLRAEVMAVFLSKGEEVAAKNVEAARRGYDCGKELRASGRVNAEIRKDPAVAGQLLLNGAEAVALGAIAGGCDAVFAYPMSPATAVFTELAHYSKTTDIVVEQVEDEIGVMNMSLGAWYAGARSLVSTSGGGFALMTEAVSLAGMIESPAVIHLSQRPGPATGLPTRTAQGDLNLALYAGHGYFPRIILAPGNTKQAFLLAQKAFNLADNFQVPVFILTDQSLMDSYYNIPEMKIDGLKIERHVVETTADYKRYAITNDGISPRGVPGHGAGRVAVDSDEHDEEGRITEDLDGVRTAMVEKRMRKAKAVRKAALAPDLIGPPRYKTLIVSWGSNYSAVAEAMDVVGDEALAFLHFTQVYPLHASTASLLAAAKHVICVENNETGQFADLLKLETGIDIKDRILKCNGMPFSVEEMARNIKQMVKRDG